MISAFSKFDATRRVISDNVVRAAHQREKRGNYERFLFYLLFHCCDKKERLIPDYAILVEL